MERIPQNPDSSAGWHPCERVDSCPTCSEDFGGEGPRRKRFAEKDAEELEEMRRELQEATGHATG